MSHLLALVVAGLLTVGARAQVDIENEIIGQPQIECLSHELSIHFQTKNPFQGHIFIRGHYRDDSCHRDYMLNRKTAGFMDVNFDMCGMRRQRMTNPRGMQMSTTVVVSFHRKFVTLNDQAYRVECFYLEEERIVEQNIEVSMLPTTDLDMRPPMPSCEYAVLADGPDGDPVQYARVGDRVFHSFQCDGSVMPDMYCMLIHSCVVDDGETSAFDVVDQQGCATDRTVLGDVQYTGDLTAGTPSSVFKFADKAHLYFTCEVQLSLKHEHAGQQCPRPVCGSVSRRRLRRADSQPAFALASLADFDMSADGLLVLDLDDPALDSHSSRQSGRLRNGEPRLFEGIDEGDNICLSQSSFGILIAAAVLSCLTAVFFAFVYFIRWRMVK